MTTTSQPPALRWQSLLPDDQAVALIEDALESGSHVLLTPTWIAQAQKAQTHLDPSLRRRLNAFAANLTSLLELAILSARQPMKVVLRCMISEPAAPSRVYVEAAPRPFFEGLGRAAQTVTALCRQIAQQYGARPAAGAPPDPAAIYPLLADLAERGQFILKGSQEWQTIAPLVERLARNPNVTAERLSPLGPGPAGTLLLAVVYGVGLFCDPVERRHTGPGRRPAVRGRLERRHRAGAQRGIDQLRLARRAGTYEAEGPGRLDYRAALS